MVDKPVSAARRRTSASARSKATSSRSRTHAAPLQLDLTFRSWGGKRPGAGRPRKQESGASHQRRPRLASRHPVHVSLSVERDLPSLRCSTLYPQVAGCLDAGKERFGFRLVHFAVQKHHLHLMVEAKDATALSRGIKGLCVRLARRLNQTVGRTGRVFSQRYFARALKTPREVRAALRYVLLQSRRHGAQRRGGLPRKVWDRRWIDPCSSGAWFDGWRQVRPVAGRPPPVAPAHSWLLRVGWRRHGLLALDDVPGR